MLVKSILLGEMDVEEQHIINFPQGIPAFESEHEFVLIELEAGGPFYYLQAVRNEELCLLLADPFTFFPQYEIDIPDEELAKIRIGADKVGLALYAVLTVPEDFKLTTANLLAPIVINHSSRVAIQFISVNTKYTTRHLIFPQPEPDARPRPVAAGAGG